MSSGTGSLGVVVPVGAMAALREVTKADRIGPVLPTVGGFSNLSFETSLDGRRVVVKVATDDAKRADLRREALVLERLASADTPMLPVPNVFCHGDTDDWTVSALDFVEGIAGYSLLASTADPRSLATLLARLLHAVQSAHPDTRRDDVDFELDLPTRLGGYQRFVETLEVDNLVRKQMLSAVESRVLHRGMGLVHGDFGLHNLLWDVRSQPSRIRVAALLDWEYAGWGSPLTDMAWFWWTLNFRDVAATVWPAFVDAYGRPALAALGVERESVLDVLRVQMIQLISRTDANSAARAEWLKRWAALDALPTIQIR